MNTSFSSDVIVRLGWRQGSILDAGLTAVARDYAPPAVTTSDGDWLVVTSHDCDIVNTSIDKEPVVEILRASTVVADIDRQQTWGRNPRALQLAVEVGGNHRILSFSVHDRWAIPRHALMQAAPIGFLPDKERRVIAEWLAKRYIRAAFPTSFDTRWRSKAKNWGRLLNNHSEWIQGVYLRLSTLAELPEDQPYKCHLLLAVPHEKRGDSGWSQKRNDLESAIAEFWEQFSPDIQYAGVDVLGTDEITLSDIEPYQRFDADWVSFEDDTSTTPVAVDMPS